MSEAPNPYQPSSFEQLPGSVWVPEGSVPPPDATSPDAGIPQPAVDFEPPALDPRLVQLLTGRQQLSEPKSLDVRESFAREVEAARRAKEEQERQEQGADPQPDDIAEGEPPETLEMPPVDVTEEQLAGRGLIGWIRALRVRKLEKRAASLQRTLAVKAGVAASYLETEAGKGGKPPVNGRKRWDKTHRVVPSGIPEVSVPVGNKGGDVVERARALTDDLRTKWAAKGIDFDAKKPADLIKKSREPSFGPGQRKQALRDLVQYNRNIGLARGKASIAPETTDERSTANRLLGEQLKAKKFRSQAGLLKDRWEQYGDIDDPHFLEAIANHPNLGPGAQKLARRDFRSYKRLERVGDRREAGTVKAANGRGIDSDLDARQAARFEGRARRLRNRELRAQTEGRMPKRVAKGIKRRAASHIEETKAAYQEGLDGVKLGRTEKAIGSVALKLGEFSGKTKRVAKGIKRRAASHIEETKAAYQEGLDGVKLGRTEKAIGSVALKLGEFSGKTRRYPQKKRKAFQIQQARNRRGVV